MASIYLEGFLLQCQTGLYMKRRAFLVWVFIMLLGTIAYAEDDEYLFVLDFASSITHLLDANVCVTFLRDKITDKPIWAQITYDDDSLIAAQKRLEKWKDSTNIKDRQISEELSSKIKEIPKIAELTKTLLGDWLGYCQKAEVDSNTPKLDGCNKIYMVLFSKDKDNPGSFTQLMDRIQDLMAELPAIIANDAVSLTNKQIKIKSYKIHFSFPKKQLGDIGQYLDSYLKRPKDTRFCQYLNQVPLHFTRMIICNYVKRGLDEIKLDDSYTSCDLN